MAILNVLPKKSTEQKYVTILRKTMFCPYHLSNLLERPLLQHVIVMITHKPRLFEEKFSAG